MEDTFDAMANGGHTSGDAVVGVTIAFTVLAVMSTCMRLYTRIFMSELGGVDDIFIATSTVSRHQSFDQGNADAVASFLQWR